MKELICPYSWDCGERFEAQKLSDHDCNFLQKATEKKMAFMFIHCPYCSRSFGFDTVKWEATASKIFANPNEKETSKKKVSTKELIAKLKKSKVEIPQNYLEYLTSENFNAEISIFSDEANFRLYDLEKLCEKINVDKNSVLRVRELKGYANSLKKMWRNDNFSLSEFADSLTIGYENERILFIDSRDNNTLWIFHPDGADIEKVSIKLTDISSPCAN
ncbi:hypothetical protein FACS189487_08950 [Campylobacterota bacterium]|nr:hypothetical protein FACS189487_08950 [Campylobacterota bacterium]